VELALEAQRISFSMLIQNVHLVKDEDGTIDRIDSFIRLQIPNEFEGVGIRDSLYFSFVSGNCLFIDRPCSKTGNSSVERFLPVCVGRELPDDVVKTGSQMMNDLPGPR